MISNVHFLRGFAAIMVVLHHALYQFQEFSFISDYPQIGALGVDIFFVISGFIIVVVTPPGTRALEFIQKRILRVVPPYWIATFILLALLGSAFLLTGSTRALAIDDIIKSLIFIPYESTTTQQMPVLVVGWTLFYEMFFYVIFAIGIATLGASRATYFAVSALAVLGIVGYLAQSQSVVFSFYTNPIILEFIWGMMLGWIWVKRRDLLDRISARGAIASVLFGSVLLLTSSGHDPLTAGGGAFFIIAGLLALERRDLKINHRISNFFGDISFSLYLLHTIALYVANVILTRTSLSDHAFIVILVLALALCAVTWLSWISYKFVEQPLGRLARRTRKVSIDNPLSNRNAGQTVSLSQKR